MKNSLTVNMLLQHKNERPVKLGDIVGEECFQNGLYKASPSYGSGTPIIRINDFDNLGHLIPENLNRVALSNEERRQYGVVENDILVNRVNSLSHVGKSMLALALSEDTVYESNMMRIRIVPDNPLIPEYVAAVLQADHSRQHFKKVAKPAVAQASINQDDVRGVVVVLYSKVIQKKLAEILKSWDFAVERTERLIALHSRRRAWLLSKLILSAGSEVKLSKILIPVSRAVPKPLEPYWALGIRSHGKGTFQRHIADPSTVDMEEVYQVRPNDLIVNITFAWEGAIAFVQPGDEHCVVSHRFPTYEIAGNVAHFGFVKYAVNHKSFFTKLGLISPGGAGRNRVLNKKDFLKLSIRLPSLDDQRKYAAVLDTAESEIALLRDQLAALKLQKSGLMQKLLTGQWQLKAPNTEAA